MSQLFFEGTAPTVEAVAPHAFAARARVILQIEGPLGILDYAIPEALEGVVQAGAPLMVPLRRRQVRAYVLAIEQGPHPAGIRLKPVTAIDEERPFLPVGLLFVVEFAARYYHVPPGEMLLAALPSSSREPVQRYSMTEKAEGLISATAYVGQHQTKNVSDATVLAYASVHRQGFTLIGVQRHLSCPRAAARVVVMRLLANGYLRVGRKRAGRRKLVTYRRTSLNSALKPSQRTLLEAIAPGVEVSAQELSKSFSSVHQKLRRLCALGFLERGEREVCVRPEHPTDTESTGVLSVRPTLTAAQQRATDAIIEALKETSSKEKVAPLLLEGVTGSGKTEVYMHAIEATLREGRSALILVPEIALTPQLSAHFCSRFGDKVATFHSGLTSAERRDEWERIRTGSALIGLGARSAVFLPLERLGLLIVDEEHETSFKQDESPRYNARDLAIYRAHREHAVVVLGSATPSLESWYRARKGAYQHLRLPDRVQSRPMPVVETIQMSGVRRLGDGIFSEALAEAVQATLAEGDQVILFLNRRGFAPYVFCRDCGHAFRCDDCDVALTLHRGKERLICHHCGFETRIPEMCPECQEHNVEAHGLGTERLEAEVRALFGDVGVARLDRDTVQRRKDLLTTLARFRRGDTRILIGTQMVTKGHDFPGVTLVGVMNADAALNFPDFRAAERTFQLLTQVAGRAGRGDKPGRVLIQTYEPEHPAIKAVLKHDYEAFAEAELEHRAELSYPPSSHLVLLRFSGEDEAATRKSAIECAAHLRQPPEGKAETWPTLLGPAPAPLQRLRGRWRFNLLLKGDKRQYLHEALGGLPQLSDPEVSRIIDVDPLHLL